MIKPNDLTNLRIALSVVVFGILLTAASPLQYGIAFFIFLLASLTDLWDGRLARRLKLESDYGKIADPIADKCLVIGTLVVMAYRGLYSGWWVLPIAAREILVTWVRIVRMRKGVVLAAEASGKLKAVVQYVTISFAFLLLIIESIVSAQIFHWLVVVLWFFLACVNGICLYSGFLFFKKLGQTSS